MKRRILLILVITGVFSATCVFATISLAQDVNSMFDGKLTFDASLSKNTKAMTSLTKAMFSEIEASINTKVYRYNGSFDEAINNVKPPSDANVQGTNEQPISATLGMFVLLSENMSPKPMSDAWYTQAKKNTGTLQGISNKTWNMTIGESAMEDPSKLKIGSTVSIRQISVTDPYFDLDRLMVIDGAWVTEIITTIVITEALFKESSGGFEDEWNGKEMDMDIGIPKGARYVKHDEVSNTEMLQGDANYLVEMGVDQVLSFYKNFKKRFCEIDEQSEMASEDGDVMVTYMKCLTHDGELKTGDDVIVLTIMKASKDILSDALGRNQGTWTLICINRWVEEDY